MPNYRKIWTLILGIGALLGAPAIMAQFTLNWTGILNPSVAPSNFIYVNCNRGEGAAGCLSTNEAPDPDNTPFLQEYVTIDGLQYWHYIIGEPNSNFAQEVYIAAGGPVWYGGSSPGSSSGGSVDWSVGGPTGGLMYPLSSNVSLSGNASGNPTRIVMQQVVNDDGMSEDFVKGSLSNKPKITQSITTSDLQLNFSVDMSSLSYSSLNTPGTITNTLNIVGTPQASFNSTTPLPSASPYVTAGEYIYIPGSGPDGSVGTYQYVDIGDVDPGQNWASFREASENPPAKP